MLLGHGALMRVAFTKVVWITCVALACAVAGCDGNTTVTTAAQGKGTVVGKPLVVACPLGVAGTRIRVDDTTNGVDLSFSTSNANAVADLRQRIRQQTERHGPERREGLGHGGRHGYAHGHGLRLWAMPPASTTIEETPAGARLVLTSDEPARRDELREAVIRRVARLEAQGCPD